MKKDGNLTKALKSMRSAGLTLADLLDPLRTEDFLRAEGIGRKQLQNLRSHAAEILYAATMEDAK